MNREYAYDKLGQTEQVTTSDSDGSLGSNKQCTHRFLTRHRNALVYFLFASLAIASFFAGFFIRPMVSESDLRNDHPPHEGATKEVDNTRAFLPQCGFDNPLPRH